MLSDLRALHIGVVEREYRFEPRRRWRADFAIPKARLIVEIEGGIFSRGRHTRGVGYRNDLEKYNFCVASGFTLFRFSTQDVLEGKSREILQKWLKTRIIS
jgi:very-short-patch-repair endonuclease